MCIIGSVGFNDIKNQMPPDADQARLMALLSFETVEQLEEYLLEVDLMRPEDFPAQVDNRTGSSGLAGMARQTVARN